MTRPDDDPDQLAADLVLLDVATQPLVKEVELYRAAIADPAAARDPCAPIAAIAERLGVQPVTGAEVETSFLIQLHDGRRYDGYALIHALLDRLDAAVKP